MNDQELLTYAAKAAGIKSDFYDDEGLFLNGERTPDNDRFWNPLKVDGDAFRLMVSLGMEVYVDTHPDGCECTEAQSHTYKTKENSMRSCVTHGDDRLKATRRAIVRAAAEIGKGM